MDKLASISNLLMLCLTTYRLGNISWSTYGQISHYGGGQTSGGKRDGRTGGRKTRSRSRSRPSWSRGHGHGVRGRVVGRGRVRLLHRQLAVVAAAVQTLGVGGTLEIFLK